MARNETGPVRRNEPEQDPSRPPDGAALASIEESMAEADRANGEGDPDAAPVVSDSGQRPGPTNT